MDSIENPQTHLTKEAYDRLVAELTELTTTRRIEIAKVIEAARQLGDLSENGDYHAAKDTQGKMEARIRHIETILATATIVDRQQSTYDTVTPGTVVWLRYDGDDEAEPFFVGSIEERQNSMPVASTGSPLGKTLLGHKPGDIIEYEAPGGKLRVEIVKIGDSANDS
ncbi:MAG: transcription elongation factor GreA [Actinobacteria bacterium]|nr:transcription elongation factor GreA [Actinomycetota bacterium]MCL6105131.1 transcription elongation factor GreA [Actinomycetota bacterium]